MVDLIPREILFGNPERTSPELSPDGAEIAWIAPRDGVLNVFVAPVSAVDDRGIDAGVARCVTDDHDRGIRSYGFAHDRRHLFYVQDLGGDENWRLYDVDLVTGERRDLTPFEETQVQVIAAEREFPDEMLIGLNLDDATLHDVYHLDLRTGALDKVLESGGLVGFLADTKLVVRAALAPQADGSFIVVVRDAADAEWRELFRVPPEDTATTDLVSFLPDGRRILALTSLGGETARLVEIDLADATMTDRYSDERYDVAGVRLDLDTREPQLVVVAGDRTELRVLDESVRADIEAITDLHHGDPVIRSEGDADKSWLVAFTNDRGPVPFYLYDRATRTARFLFFHQPALSNFELAPMEPFTLRARDGLELHGYATFPLGVERRGLPAVLFVHGGPWVRDQWGFDATAQWLANRGYVCLQVNYRGSTGFGKSFVNAGDREWGGAMHTDLLDACAFAIETGWVDPSRIAIYGGSYGGYAALWGAAFSSDVFCCAVDIVGPSNLVTLIRTIPPYWEPLIAEFHRRVGNPDTEEEFLWSRSPLSRAKDIAIPLLIAQGANDPRVKQEESEQIVAALNDAGIDHEYLLFADEGHGFAKPENRLSFQRAAERFLAAHLGGRAEA